MKSSPFLIALAAVLLAGCASIPPARLQLPDGLDARSEAMNLGPFGPGRKGQAQIDGRELRYERSASRLDLFKIYASDKAALRFQLAGVEADCGVRRRELSLAGITASQPTQVHCQLSPLVGLVLRAASSPGRGLEPRPAGELVLTDGRRLQVLASFQIQGTPLPSGEPMGYLFAEQGRVVGAIDTNNRTAYLPRGDAALREACLRAGLALSLLWMPDD